MRLLAPSGALRAKKKKKSGINKPQRSCSEENAPIPVSGHKINVTRVDGDHEVTGNHPYQK